MVSSSKKNVLGSFLDNLTGITSRWGKNIGITDTFKTEGERGSAVYISKTQSTK